MFNFFVLVVWGGGGALIIFIPSNFVKGFNFRNRYFDSMFASKVLDTEAFLNW